jgi:50S ribosome-binding GTPase
MDATDHRILVSSLADDLSWLEEHCRRQTSLAQNAGQLRLAAALVRNVVGPALDGQSASPLHIAVVGGAGTGKSTVVNFLVGQNVAEANPQAGYTRHPTAYVVGSGPTTWTGHLGFLGPLQRIEGNQPANKDEDVYQVQRVNVGEHPLGDVVIWDCPDMTTWAASNYVSRLIEIAGLADVIVYVASDERYNDEVPTQFLHVLIRCGKPVVVALTKMNATIATAIVEHFQMEILGRLPKGPTGKSGVPVVAIPFLTPAQRENPAKEASQFRIPLLNQILAMAQEPSIARTRNVKNAVEYLEIGTEGLLQGARLDLQTLDAWRATVVAGQGEFENRYRNEFLNGEGFRRFDEARERLLNLLELPGAGKGFAVAMWALRFPYRMLRNVVAKAVTRPNAVNLSESATLDNSFRAWVDQLRAEAIRRADSHSLWKHIANGFGSGLGDTATDRFKTEARGFQLSSAEEIESVARGVGGSLEQQPGTLAVLRGGKLLLDAVAIGLGVWAGWFDWQILIWVPLFVSIGHQFVELLVRSYVERKRSAVRAKKIDFVHDQLAQPLANWLSEWPATGGSAYEKLQTVLRRLPESIRNLRTTAQTRFPA